MSDHCSANLPCESPSAPPAPAALAATTVPETALLRAPVRLLIVIIDLDGGTGTFCRNLAAGLQTYCPGEFVVDLLLFRARGVSPSDRELFSRIEILGSTIHDNWQRFYETFLHLWQLRRGLRRMDADIILTVGTYANLLAPVVARRVPVVLSEHVSVTHRMREAQFGSLTGQLMRMRYRRNLLVAPAHGLLEDLRLHFGVRRVQCIPHGVDVQKVRELADRSPADIPGSGPYLLACGRLTPVKDYPTLLRAFAAARSQGLEHRLLIVGNGEDRAALGALADQLGLGDSVVFLGHRANPFAYMKQADLFVLSSVWEGFGYVLLEAMSLGLPCIATDCPTGPPEILDGGRSGILVPSRNPQALADAMLRVANDPQLRQRMSEQSLARAEELNLERMIRQYRDLFMCEIHRHGGARSRCDAPTASEARA